MHIATRSIGVIAFAILLAPASFAAAQDEIELLSGAKVAGKVVAIDKAEKTVAFEAKIAGRSYQRTYPYNKIHAVTYNGKRYVITEKTDGGSAPPADGGANSGSPTAPTNVKAIIDQAGRTAPDWYESTPLDYPKSLDMNWPAKPPGNWNNQKNVGQYLWDVIYPNPNRWRSGVKLIHHLLAQHHDNAEIRQRAMSTLGNMYFNLFQDYARAAFWWQQAGVGGAENHALGLAECYWRLGDRRAAEALLADPDKPRSNNTLRVGMIKLWGDMGETTKAVKVAEWYVKAGGEPHAAYLFAGDACRLAGQYQEALRYYQKVVAAPDGANKKRSDQDKKRAAANLQAIKLFELSDPKRVPDGRYQANSIGYSGPVEVEVQVQSGRIASVRVTKHVEKQFYAALTDVPNQIIAKQGVKGVDATSRATMTGEAIINAVAKALASAAK